MQYRYFELQQQYSTRPSARRSLEPWRQMQAVFKCALYWCDRTPLWCDLESGGACRLVGGFLREGSCLYIVPKIVTKHKVVVLCLCGGRRARFFATAPAVSRSNNEEQRSRMLPLTAIVDVVVKGASHPPQDGFAFCGGGWHHGRCRDISGDTIVGYSCMSWAVRVKQIQRCTKEAVEITCVGADTEQSRI